MPSFNPPPKYGLVVVAWANARLKQLSSSSPPSAAAKQQLPPDGLGAPAMVLGQVVEAVRGSPLEQLLSSNANASFNRPIKRLLHRRLRQQQFHPLLLDLLSQPSFSRFTLPKEIVLTRKLSYRTC